MGDMTLEKQVKIVVDALADKKAEDVRTYDVRGVSGLCDVFVVATGVAAPHLKGLAAGVQQAMKTEGVALALKGAIFTRTGYTQTGWSLYYDGSTKDYDFGAAYTENASVTLYPYWTASGPANDSFSSPTTISGASGSAAMKA